MASAGSLEPLGRYGVAGLPTVTLLSAENALASAGTARTAATASNATKMAERRIIVGYLPYGVLCKDLGSIAPASGNAQAPGRCPRSFPGIARRAPHACLGQWGPLVAYWANRCKTLFLLGPGGSWGIRAQGLIDHGLPRLCAPARRH